MNFLAQYSEYPETQDVGILPLIIGLLFLAISIVSMWKLFAKAGQPGWAAIIPIYNLVIYLKIIKQPLWMIILAFVPLVNFVVGIYWLYLFIKHFGGGTGMFILAIFFPYFVFLYLAFSDAHYHEEIE